MRRLPLALVTILLTACSVARKPADVPPPPVVESGGVLSSAPMVPRDVSEDGTTAPQTATAAVLVVNDASRSSVQAASGMLMWSSSWSQSSLSSLSAGSGSDMSVASVTVPLVGSGKVVTASGASVGTGTVTPPRATSSSSSSSVSSVLSSASGGVLASSSASTVSSVQMIQPPVQVPSSSAGAVGAGGVQPRRVANNLVLSIETDYEAVPPGGLIQLSIPVRNFSTGPAEGFLVEASVPEGATIIDAVLGEIDGRSVRWRFNQLLENQMYTLHFAVRAPRSFGSNMLLPFSARVSGGNLGGSAIVTTNVTVQESLPQTGVDLGATILGEARTSAADGQRTALIAAILTAAALAVGLLAGRVLASQRQ